jgi:hypothetical protein
MIELRKKIGLSDVPVEWGIVCKEDCFTALKAINLPFEGGLC